jgi:RNA polymerase sigma-70 factor (ECF subfamily)
MPRELVLAGTKIFWIAGSGNPWQVRGGGKLLRRKLFNAENYRNEKQHSPTMSSDAPLTFLSELDGLRALDAQAITAVHNRYYPEIYRFARYRLGDEHLAEDVAADVFVRLLEAVHAGRGPQTSLRGWLFGTTSHLINDHFRKTYARPVDTLDEEMRSAAADPSALAEAGEQQHKVRQALSGLTEEQQQVLALRFGSAYSLEETAELMGKNANAIKALQFRALAALRRGMAELFHTGDEL